jgi:uncharacterized protein YbjT (DUF2867 family)
LPEPCSIAADFNRDTNPEIWQPRLSGVDAVINCVGVLQGGFGQSIEAVHTEAPIALFEACIRAGVRRVIQISAISAEPAARTAYAQTKCAADEFLRNTSLDWVILRPSLVYAEGAYGGTALFRAFAALPFAIPLPGKGDGTFRPIHMDDLTATILKLIETPAISRVIIDPVGPDRLAMRDILCDLRRWLGYAPARMIEIPMPFVRLAAHVGDLLGSPINSTALRQMEFGNDGPLEPFVSITGINPCHWHAALIAHPAQTQDRWHARLYFLRPLLRISIAVMWLASGLAGIVHRGNLTTLLTPHIGMEGAQILIWFTSLFDIAIAGLVVARWRTGLVAAIQLMAVITYTLAITMLDPALWLAPFGPLLKNLPVLVAIAVLAAIEPER